MFQTAKLLVWSLITCATIPMRSITLSHSSYCQPSLMHGNAGEDARAFALVRRSYWFAFQGLLQTDALRINVTRTKVMKFPRPIPWPKLTKVWLTQAMSVVVDWLSRPAALGTISDLGGRCEGISDSDGACAGRVLITQQWLHA